MKKIVFLTGTRADYGKIKSLMKKVMADSDFELYLFVTGMHMLSTYGSTWREIEKDQFNNVYHYINQTKNTSMSIALSNTITGLNNYLAEINPDLIVVHGDRLEALAGAIVGAFHNIRVVHIEGGEVSGTIDESIRHAITKFAHIHLVSNEESKTRILQLGEDCDSVYVIGSPDIDVMYSENLPSIEKVKQRYEIQFERYSILLYHPVTTEVEQLEHNISVVIDSLKKSGKNYVVIYPNNDNGSELILKKYSELEQNRQFRIFPSIRFEYFLTLMRNADFLIGNSSAGIRETTEYGIPSIDIGNRQFGRYNPTTSETILHVDHDEEQILEAIYKEKVRGSNTFISRFGTGESADKFMQLLKIGTFWEKSIQKKFIDMNLSEVMK